MLVNRAGVLHSHSSTVVYILVARFGFKMSSNKPKLMRDIALATGISQNNVNLVINGLIAHITQAVKKGNLVTVSGFGTFSANKREAHNIIDLQTGLPRLIPAANFVKFKQATALKKSVN